MLITFLLIIGVIYLVTFAVLGAIMALTGYCAYYLLRAIILCMGEVEHSINTLE